MIKPLPRCNKVSKVKSYPIIESFIASIYYLMVWISEYLQIRCEKSRVICSKRPISNWNFTTGDNFCTDQRHFYGLRIFTRNFSVKIHAFIIMNGKEEGRCFGLYKRLQSNEMRLGFRQMHFKNFKLLLLKWGERKICINHMEVWAISIVEKISRNHTSTF